MTREVGQPTNLWLPLKPTWVSTHAHTKEKEKGKERGVKEGRESEKERKERKKERKKETKQNKKYWRCLTGPKYLLVTRIPGWKAQKIREETEIMEENIYLRK